MKSILASVVIFLLGMVAGGSLVYYFSPPLFHRHHPGDMKHHLIDYLTFRLKLTSDQRTKITPIIDEEISQLDAARTQNDQTIEQIMQAADQKLAANLNPAQQAELQKMEAERQHMMGHARSRPPMP